MTKSMTVIIEPTFEGNNAVGIVSNSSKQTINLKLEPEFWTALDEICLREQSSIHAVCTAVYMTKASRLSLDRAIRIFITDYFQRAATEEGHTRAGHGTFCIPKNSHQVFH